MILFEKITAPLGMIGVLLYLVHSFIGKILWKEYNPISMVISSLTANGAPNARLLRIYTLIYGIFITLFIIGLVIKSFRKYHRAVRNGYIVLLIMQIISLIGHKLFPLSVEKTIMDYQNIMHIIITAIVVLSTIAAGFILAYGYIKQEKMKKLGKFILTMAIIITITGVFSPIAVGVGLNILGLTERLTIYSLQIMMFVISYYYVFIKKEYIYDKESL